MITMQVFMQEVKFLSEWFSKPLTQQIFERLHASLSEHLTDEEFLKACKIAFETERFFPNTVKFIELAHGSLDERAAADWAIAYTIASGTQPKEPLSQTGTKALKTIGGQSRIGRCNPEQLDWLRREFVDAWKASYTPCTPKADRPQLPSVQPVAAISPSKGLVVGIEDSDKVEQIKGMLAARRAARQKPSPTVLNLAREFGLDVSEWEEPCVESNALISGTSGECTRLQSSARGAVSPTSAKASLSSEDWLKLTEPEVLPELPAIVDDLFAEVY